MLIREKDRNASVSAAEVTGRVVPHDQTWARSEPTTKAGMASCIGSDMSIVGNIECKGPAQVFGRIEGEVRASDLQVSDGAEVEGTVIAQNVTVGGRVKGAIRAVRVKLQNPSYRLAKAAQPISHRPRQSMSHLRSLTFTTLPKIGSNPTVDRRTNMIARLEEQKLLLSGPNYIRTLRTWVKKNGELTPVDKQQRVFPWWRVNADGSYVFFVRLGSKPIEFEKGKNAIAVPSLDKVPLVIDILITAVRNGELDQQLAQAKKPETVPKYLKTVNNLIALIETMTDAPRMEESKENKTKVLYVEHNDDNLYMLKTRLELLGDFEVLAAEDSDRGCKLAVTERPDVILMDLEMPVTDRWESVRRLKKDLQTRDIPIIGMSAYALASEREKAIATGCDDFDAKPIEFESLVATIRRVLADPQIDIPCCAPTR
jgi:CheY-like chemotaxis protein